MKSGNGYFISNPKLNKSMEGFGQENDNSINYINQSF